MPVFVYRANLRHDFFSKAVKEGAQSYEAMTAPSIEIEYNRREE